MLLLLVPEFFLKTPFLRKIRGTKIGGPDWGPILVPEFFLKMAFSGKIRGTKNNNKLLVPKLSCHLQNEQYIRAAIVILILTCKINAIKSLHIILQAKFPVIVKFPSYCMRITKKVYFRSILSYFFDSPWWHFFIV